jgi:hypothetical protein
MPKRLLTALMLLSSLAAAPVVAQQAKQFDQYTVHYNALSTSLLTPQVAQAYGIKRSANRGLLNIAVLADGVPVRALVKADVRNLAGQRKSVDIREIVESGEDSFDGIYSIGEFRAANMETFIFDIAVQPEGSSAPPYRFSFSQQFFSD